MTQATIDHLNNPTRLMKYCVSYCVNHGEVRFFDAELPKGTTSPQVSDAIRKSANLPFGAYIYIMDLGVYEVWE